MADKSTRFNLIEEISQVNAHGRIFVARSDDDRRELTVVKIPKNMDDAKELHTEYCVFDALGRHENIVHMIEYSQKEPCYMAM